RCQQTLKDYLHTRHKVTPQQKYKLIRDMIVAVKVMHENGIAHRDLSEINVMVNVNPGSLLKDNSLRPKAVIIDFGRALFVRAEDVSKWSTRKYGLEELKLLPKIYTAPDHGYKRYRSICTLPKHKQDHDVLPYPVDPLAEDVYSLGILIWRTLSQQNPWPGVFDEDIRGLREIVGNEERMHKEICRSIKGMKCRELLLGCLAVNPEERWTAKILFDWIWNSHNRRRLIREFGTHFQGRNASRKASVHGE
ncbi:kinase-like protein, partial [Basidiobolus meristosporus CBS 931.73]